MIGSGATLARSRPITGLLGLWHTSVGKKFVMAVSGFILFGYLVLHLWGNLKIFESREAVNTWGVFLREFGDPVLRPEWILWVVRVILLAAVVLHIWAAVDLTRLDRKARPVAYAMRRNQESTYASRTMRWGGVIVLLFIVWHILDLTTGTVNPDGDASPYDRLVASFSNPFSTAFYVLALILLGTHLRHGIWSATQTLGQSNKRRERTVNAFAIAFSTALIAGFLLVPLSVLFGLVD